MKTTYLLILAVSLGATGCASYRLISNEKDAWIEKGGGGDELYYCRSNPDNAGKSAPECTEAEIHRSKSHEGADKKRQGTY
jgi:hypothetical protein